MLRLSESVETGAEPCLNINMSTEMWLKGVTKNSAHAYKHLHSSGVGGRAVDCAWAFSALSIYLSLHRFPSVTLSVNIHRGSLQHLVQLSSPSPTACCLWGSLRWSWHCFKKAFVFAVTGTLLKYFFNPQFDDNAGSQACLYSHLWLFRSLFLSSVLWARAFPNTCGPSVWCSRGSSESLIKPELGVFTSGFVSCQRDNISVSVPLCSACPSWFLSLPPLVRRCTHMMCLNSYCMCLDGMWISCCVFFFFHIHVWTLKGFSSSTAFLN